MENTGDKNDEFNLEERTARFGEAVLRFADMKDTQKPYQ